MFLCGREKTNPDHRVLPEDSVVQRLHHNAIFLYVDIDATKTSVLASDAFKCFFCYPKMPVSSKNVLQLKWRKSSIFKRIILQYQAI